MMDKYFNPDGNLKIRFLPPQNYNYSTKHLFKMKESFDGTNYGYHKKQINKGVLGGSSKITEEYEEFIDSIEQNNPIMSILELADLIGAIEAYAAKYNYNLGDLIQMKDATKRAFETGHRK